METIMMNKQEDIKMSNTDRNPGILSLFLCKCPRCRRGDMFVTKNPWKLKTTMKMHKECPVCKQPFNIEVGFYYGSSYISYALALLMSVITFILWYLIFGFSLNSNSIFYWMGFNAVFLVVMQPYLMRVARTGWLAFFVRYNKNWRTVPPPQIERTNREQENNW